MKIYFSISFEKFFEEDVELPEGEEALPMEAELLIKHLLEKDPIERIGSAGGAQQVCFFQMRLCCTRQTLSSGISGFCDIFWLNY